MRPSASRNGPGEWADHNAPDRRDLIGRIRRMAISLTSRALWQLVGHDLPDGRAETRMADVFSGIGFYARPRSSDRTEAIVLMPGGAGHPVVVGTRNEDARKAIQSAINSGAGLAENETIVYSAAALVHIKANGTVEIRTPGGTAVALATLADVQALRTTYNSHTHAGVTVGASVTAIPGAIADAPTGTTKLKGE